MTKSNQSTKKALVAASLAGLLAVTGASLLNNPPAQAAGDHCYGVNKCKGTGDCGGKGHSCAGMNECKGQGWLEIDSDTCLKIQGGRLSPEK